MALPARDNRISRRRWLMAGLAIPLLARAEEPLDVSFDGDNIRVFAPGLHFLKGRPLERLKNADTVAFVSQITLFTDAHGTVFRRFPERLVVSYDLWEEKFSVTIPGPSKRSQRNLSAAQAESWCLENMAISALGLAPDRPFWVKFELRTSDRRELTSLVGDSGVSLSRLIDFLSGPKGNDLYWHRETGPLRLRDLPRIFGSRGRNG